MLLFRPRLSADHPSFALDPIPPAPNPAAAWDRPLSCSPLAVLHLPRRLPLPPPSACSPSTLPTFSSRARSHRQTPGPAGPVWAAALILPSQQGEAPNHCPDLGRVKGGNKGPGLLPSLCPVAVQHPDLLLSPGKAGVVARAAGHHPCVLPIQALETRVSWQWCLLMTPAEM